jgi:hypothetical protein
MCFGIAVVTEFYVGYAVIALLVEINSIFLHIRQLLRFLDFSKDNPVYRLNSLMNIGKSSEYCTCFSLLLIEANDSFCPRKTLYVLLQSELP